MQPTNDRYMEQLGKMQRPIPGSSLTNDPESPLPFEGPPEITSRKAAVEEVFSNMIRPDIYPQLMEAVIKGSTIMEITQVILFEGFRAGKWNPDMFLMLVEPTAYMLMALAERADIDYVIDNDEDEPEPASELEKKFEMLSKRVKGTGVKAGVLPRDVEKRIRELPVESLLAKPEQEPMGEVPMLAEEAPEEEMPMQEESLLAPGV